MSSEMLPRDQMIVALVLLGFVVLDDSYSPGSLQYDLGSPILDLRVCGGLDSLWVDPYSDIAECIGPGLQFTKAQWDVLDDEALRAYYDKIMEALKCHAKL